MDFELTDDRAALRDEAREFARTEIAPRASELDRNREYPAEILGELGERRLTGLTIPEAYGGRGEGTVELALVTEELSAAMMPVASAMGLHLGVAEAIERFGTEAQREAYLPEMARFETVGALGLSETNAGSDKRSMETEARKAGDEWVLDGHKRWVTNYFDADVVLTYAKTGGDPRTTSPPSSSRPTPSRSNTSGTPSVPTASSRRKCRSRASACPTRRASATSAKATSTAATSRRA
ncbi:acyl-CoA dehydrogenase family protein [Haloplanus sp. GCM10025708]|uniref:acyl-CoA dehydrogenase family protein n=1 Tax=Haloplanus sp. GCM10025708 TaxID=3252679 RepID=UPI00361DA2D7